MSLCVFLLRGCPYSQKLSKEIERFPQIQKKWVVRGSKAFHEMKAMYSHPTFPIVVFTHHDEKYVIGGYTEFMKLVGTSRSR